MMPFVDVLALFMAWTILTATIFALMMSAVVDVFQMMTATMAGMMSESHEKTLRSAMAAVPMVLATSTQATRATANVLRSALKPLVAR